jgi:mannose-6-phosphate isomerase class I
MSGLVTGVKYLVIDCYNGVDDSEVKTSLMQGLKYVRFVDTADVMLAAGQIEAFFKDDVTDDEIFGYITRYNIDAYFDAAEVDKLRDELSCTGDGIVVVYGVGAAYIAPRIDLLVYADMARWEIQMRYRRNEAWNVGLHNRDERSSLKYKRGFFTDWRILDRHKKRFIEKWDYVLDTNKQNEPKMATGEAVRDTLKQAACRPFRVVPFFDPGPWGGQWMKKVYDLDKETINFAWCFDCVPEENSLLLQFGNALFEIPSINMVFYQPRQLLGEAVHGRFGDEFPIRFDFLDTMDGGNLSLQVHPLTEYIQEKFGMHYTQDESYYMLDAKPGAFVYLGLKENVNPDAMIDGLEQSLTSGSFDAERHVGKYPVKKHDHVLIPAGTVHCSGKDSMVLEISATPYIFTFKLWDWGRLDLDGRPRPINIEHGRNSIQWDRTESWVKDNLLNRITTIDSGDGWLEESTGLHQREFIETRRFWFTKTTCHHTCDGVNVINLVEGNEVVVESPQNAFEPFVVHYAETFIVPAGVGAYTIRPYGKSEGQECGIIKAFVR